MASRITASFNLRGDDLDPAEVTRSLGIDPTNEHRKGEDRRGPRFKEPWSQGWWSLESGLPQSEAFEAHVEWLFEKLEPKRGAIQEILQDGCTADLRIAFFSDCDQVGIRVSAKLVERIAKLGAHLDLSGYAS